MNDRKKQISELERQKREQIVLLDGTLARLGETIFNRVNDSFIDMSHVRENTAAFEELTSYRRLQNDISNARSSIQDIEEQIKRFGELEANIESAEREESACAKELSVAYGQLGKQLLDLPEDSSSTDFCASYREQARALLTKVLSLEERLSGLDQREGSNVFTWIGKSAHSLVLNSFLAKARENLEQLRRTVGERYCRGTQPLLSVLPDGDSSSVTGEIDDLCAVIEGKKGEQREIAGELSVMREEKRKISAGFTAEGGPHKYIQTLNNNIARAQDELKIIYRRTGSAAAGIISPIDTAAEQYGQIFASLMEDPDSETVNNAARINRSIRDNETAIEKLKAAIAIDEENAKIEKYQKMIKDKREKIARAENSIEEYGECIADSQAAIEKLQKLL